MVNLHSLQPRVEKPGGGEFQFWKNETTFTKTYHVEGRSAASSDENPGTRELPFRTIGRAAEIVQPGERVLVHAGIYRECIRPPRGGLSPEQMIGYHADTDGEVIVKGSDAAGRQWIADDGVWTLDLKTFGFGEYRPFSLDNLPDASFDLMEWATNLRGKLPFTLPRGMVFQDGQRLTRMATREEMQATEGSHWTDRAANVLHVRTRGGANPNDALMELTTRRACVRPVARGLGFIHVRGFIFEQVGNGFPRPQEGAVSVCSGHHWLIEANTVRQVNGIGIDIGTGWYGGRVLPPEAGTDAAEWNIVRGNHVSETGVCGIAGLRATNALIEDNVLRNNTIYPVGRIAECAAIKTHINRGTLIRRNFITNDAAISASTDRAERTIGIWMDWDNRDTRCTQNVMVHCTWGIYLEASVVEPACMVDRNVIWGAREGIHEADCTGQRFVHNLVGCSQAGIVLCGKVSERVVAENYPTAGGGHLVANNVMFEVNESVRETKKAEFTASVVAGNASEQDGVIASLDVETGRLNVSGPAGMVEFCAQVLVTHDLKDRAWPAGVRCPGPVGMVEA